MKKQKIFSILSLMGLIYVVWLGANYFIIRNIEPLDAAILPQDFEKQFSKVTLKKRPERIVDLSFLDKEGHQVSFNTFKGKHLLVNFWATWCTPCVVELPSLDKLKDALSGKNIEIIAVSLDMQRSHAAIKTFLANRNIGDFAAYLDEKQTIEKNIRMRGIPTTLLINPRGEITHIFEGDANWASPSALSFFNTVLLSK